MKVDRAVAASGQVKLVGSPSILGILAACVVVLTMACSAESAPGSGSEKAENTAQTGDPCLNEGTDGATATCLKPTKSMDYYAEQASKYFDTLDTDADPNSVPNYSEFVARWEWPPWLLLTGYGKKTMIDTGKMLKKLDPSTVPKRDCRGFKVQPFARCYVVFEYEHGKCPIYEEFTFNDAGEMTFIEAWSDLPKLTPITDGEDRWAERHDIKRLATRVPGLGKSDGKIELDGKWMLEAAKTDKDVAELNKRAKDQWTYWSEELNSAPKDFFAKGCGW